MSYSNAPVWINANPSFKRFDGRIIRYLSHHLPLAYWEYSQTQDEACSLQIAMTLLHDYLKSLSEPVSLIGHGTGGLVGLLYARKYPHKVKSLTLLGVGANPAIDWQAHYYALRKLLSCSQEFILARMVQILFGYQQNRVHTQDLIAILEQDLITSPSPHSLFQHHQIEPGGVLMPLMICGSDNDSVVDSLALHKWLDYLKPGDEIWTHPNGHHFFHYFFPEAVGKQILEFWQQFDRQLNNKVSSVELTL